MMPPLEHEIIKICNITLDQFSLVFLLPMLMSAFACIPGGILGDRYGIRYIVGVSIFLEGVFLIFRLYATSFLGLVIPMLLIGILQGFIITNLPKLVSIWFPPEEAGTASGICVSGIGIGMTIGLLTGGFMGWHLGSLVFTLLVFIVGAIWMVLARDSPPGVELPRPPVLAGVKNGLRSRNLWGATIGNFFFFGGLMIIMTLLPQALHEVYGKSMAMGGILTSMITGGIVMGNLIWPTISDKITRVNPVIMGCAICAGTFIFLGWMGAETVGVWPLMFIGGIFLGGAMALMIEIPAMIPFLENPDYDQGSTAGATGILTTAFFAGGFFIPNFVFIPLFVPHYTILFLAASVLLVIPAVSILLVKEIGEVKE